MEYTYTPSLFTSLMTFSPNSIYHSIDDRIQTPVNDDDKNQEKKSFIG